MLQMADELHECLVQFARVCLLISAQNEALDALIAGKEVLSILPTNLGKCVIYPVFCFAKISKACVLSIWLLNSILVEQVLKLNELGHLAV